MNVGKVEEYKLEIGKKEYTFRLDMSCILKLEKKYENSTEIINQFLSFKKEFTNAIKILSCACVEKEWTEEEFANSLSADFPTMKVIDGICYSMIQGAITLDKSEDEKKDKKAKTKKNK
ncbi:hypothetical protein [Clostridium felsineum]|uniref:hypothetical protein n=1 Tax=Clostridium felsineum TaxID=36839 RepID=UPI00098C8522|nr:hypothetical protein [Clostridium felsineum]URZ15334.1 hypothetical protein CLFE_013520 [Clostridium felsineum DSM 794]